MRDNLGDWRISAVTTLAEDVPAAYSGGPSHKAGALVYQVCLVETEEKEHVGFTLPSATAMAFDIALQAAISASQLKNSIEYEVGPSPVGSAKCVKDSSTESLFNFFEQCMTAVTFSFQAIEVFSNHSISRSKFPGMDIKRKKKRQFFSAQEIERNLSTEEKLATVLPVIFGIPTPKGKKTWEGFKSLKKARDASIHLKYHDQYATGIDSLFFQFLKNDPLSYPVAAFDIIKYFYRHEAPRWLKEFERKLDAEK